jgi:hypothetical protein
MDKDYYPEPYEEELESGERCDTCLRFLAECDHGRKGREACGMYLSGE